MGSRSEKVILAVPEIPFFLGIICGCTVRYPVMLCLLVIFALLSFRRRKRFFCMLWAGFAAGCISLAVHAWSQNACQRELPDRNVRVTLQCLCIDSRISHAPGMLRPGTFSAQIRYLNGRKLKTAPEILVRVPRGSALPRCGESFSGSGVLTKYGLTERLESYFQAQSISAFWEPEEILTTGEISGLTAYLCRFRDKILEKILRNVHSDRARVIAGTMFFGTTGGFDAGMKRIFLFSGTLHLFSVSGMHLMIIAGLLLGIFRFFPLRFRYILLGAVLTMYALTTGANPPVMRALIVVLCWCTGKIFFFRKEPLALLALAGSILLLFSPSLVFDVGTQYSFLITAVLILTGEKIKQWRSAHECLYRSVPYSPLTGRILNQSRRIWKFSFAVAGALSAFAAGIGISAAHGNLVLPGTILLNLLLCFLVPPLFFMTGLRLLPGEILPAEIYEKSLLFLNDLCIAGSESFVPLELVGTGTEAVLFALAFLLFLCWSRRGLFFSLAAGILLLWCLRPWCAPSEAVFVSGDSATPPLILISEPREGLAFVVNAPDHLSVEAAVRFMYRRGIRKTEALFFTPEPSAARAVSKLFRQVPAERVCLPREKAAMIRKKIDPREIKNVVPGDRTREFVKIFKEKSVYCLEYFNPGSKLRLCIKWYDTAQGRCLSVNGKPFQCIFWKYSPEVLIYGFPEK